MTEETENVIQKFAQFDDAGLPKAFFSSDIHSDIPDDAVPISDEQYLKFISNAGARKWQDGEVVEYVAPGPSPEEIATERDTQIQAAMRFEADPLFFKWQAGEISKQVWLDKRQEIRGRLAS